MKNVTSCLTPSSKTAEVLGAQVGHVVRRALGDGHVQRDEIDAGAERGLRRRAGWRRRLLGAAIWTVAAMQACADEREAPMKTAKPMDRILPVRDHDLFLVSLTDMPRAVNPGLFVATVNRSGGMSDCGRAYVTWY